MRTRRTSLAIVVATFAATAILASKSSQDAGAAPIAGPAAPAAPTTPRTLPAMALAPRRGAVPAPPGSFVTKSCSRSVAHVSICSDADHCTEVLAAPCAPLGCDATKTWCASSCVTSADCSAGSACDTTTNRCAWSPVICSDAFTIEEGTGNHFSCAPYRCKNGRCWEVCASDADCSTGYVCKDNVSCVKQ